jgi:hypothetical protein
MSLLFLRISSLLVFPIGRMRAAAMLLTRALPAIIGLCGFASAKSSHKLPSPPGDSFYTKEIDVVAQLKSRLTGSTNHTNFIDYLERELRSLGLKVISEYFDFDYNTLPSPLALSVNGQSVPPSAYVPYSGDTGASGVSGSLVQIADPAGATVSPDWAPAKGKIAVVNITNTPTNGATVFPVWPGSQQWGAIPGIPATNAGVKNLTAAAAAGVKGVIYNWLNISSLNALGQYGPFKINYQGVPALYVTNQALENAQAKVGQSSMLTSTGTLIHKRRTRAVRRRRRDTLQKGVGHHQHAHRRHQRRGGERAHCAAGQGARARRLAPQAHHRPRVPDGPPAHVGLHGDGPCLRALVSGPPGAVGRQYIHGVQGRVRVVRRAPRRQALARGPNQQCLLPER